MAASTPRLPVVDPLKAEGKAKTLLDAVKTKMGMVPNMTRVLANAPAALEGYLAFSGALAGASLDAKIREQIALAVAETNLCDYCLSAHTVIGAKAGLAAKQIADARRGVAEEPKANALIRLARSLTVQKGEVNDGELAEARAAGVSDAEIVEVIALVSLNIYTNYVNHVARPPIDFPVVKPGV